jgi:flagellar protein FliL
MADIPTLEPAPNVALDDDAGNGRKRSRLVLAAVAAVVLAAAGAGVWLFLGRSASQSKSVEAAHAPTGPALYVALDPPFVTNFEADQTVRFLQLTVQIMTHDPATVDLVKANDPVVRNDLLLLFSNQKYEDIATRAGKEKLRSEALAAVRKVVAENGGKPDRVEAVYFTSFVMQ